MVRKDVPFIGRPADFSLRPACCYRRQLASEIRGSGANATHVQFSQAKSLTGSVHHILSLARIGVFTEAERDYIASILKGSLADPSVALRRRHSVKPSERIPTLPEVVAELLGSAALGTILAPGRTEAPSCLRPRRSSPA